MRTRKLYTLLIFILPVLFLVSCVEEFWPDLKDLDEDLLVVDGRITNEPGPYTIKLSRSHNLNEIPSSTNSIYDFKPVMGATVKFIDDLDNEYDLTEVEDGIYQTNAAELQGEVGRSYKLTIAVNGKNYESSFQLIKDPVPIESVDYVEHIENDQLGFKFDVTSAVSAEENNYYLWEIAETYEYHSPYRPTHYYAGLYADWHYDMGGNLVVGEISDFAPYNTLRIDFHPDSMAFCWKTDVSTTIYRASTEFSDEPQVRNFDLNFVPYQDLRLRIKYSLLVKQHSLNEDAYKFYSELEDQNSYDDDELYTKQPYQIRGNISNVNNQNEPVLGFFYASGIAEKRIFAPNDPQPLSEIEFAVEYCLNIPSVYYELGQPVNNTKDYIENSTDIRWPIYLGKAYIFYKQLDPIDYPLWFIAYSKSCIDCARRGGSYDKPDYWD